MKNNVIYCNFYAKFRLMYPIMSIIKIMKVFNKTKKKRMT